MNKTLKFIPIFLACIMIFSAVLAPTHTFAKLTPDCGSYQPVLDSQGKPMLDEKGNPKKEIKECQVTDLFDLINTFIGFLLFTLAPSLLAVILCYVGFIFITSGGSSEARTKAKKILKNVVLGYIIALAAWIIIHTIFKALGSDAYKGFLKE